MEMRDNISPSSQDTAMLSQRIAENIAAQEIDLVEWIFSKLKVKSGANILELCSGTGGQTLRLLELIGLSGKVVAVDVSREGLDTLVSKVDGASLPRLTTIEANIDQIGQTLKGAGFTQPYFDLVFCAYGLYYSADASLVLKECKLLLHPLGEIIIVGPFGPNNNRLFEFLQQSGVEIPSSVKYSSQTFMFDEVVPWATENFQSVIINTVVNRIKWTSPDNILNYWKNSTFYKAEKLPTVRSGINRYFDNHSEFVNEKWIMMVEAMNARL
jgi:ubiquinone/menaquinone biosynthesis C-methylase UbiE